MSESVEIRENYGNLSSDIVKRGHLSCTPNCSASVGTEIQATFNLSVTQCLNRTETIEINTGSSNDRFEIELDVICGCDCGNPEKTSNRCHNNGDTICGVCECRDNWSGKECECNKLHTEDIDDMECKNMLETCSGHGTCICGTCKCADGYKGKFCECDDNSCPRKENVLCSGNGDCKCGSCKCNIDFTGEACDCPIENTSCIEPKTKNVCSERGKCECGKCDCFENYYGSYCEKCVACQKR